MILIDVNVLVHAHRTDSDCHEEIREWLEKALTEPADVSVSDLALSGCLRIITHPKVFKEPTPLSAALEYVGDLRSRHEVHVISPGPAHWRIFFDLCRTAEARGNLVPDAYHGAMAIEHGCEWVTLDRGFARFKGLRWRHPLDDGD